VCKVNQGLQIPISERFGQPSEKVKVYITIQYLNGKSDAEYIESYTDNYAAQINSPLYAQIKGPLYSQHNEHNERNKQDDRIGQG